MTETRLYFTIVDGLSEVRSLTAKAVYSMCEHFLFVVSLFIGCAKYFH